MTKEELMVFRPDEYIEHCEKKQAEDGARKFVNPVPASQDPRVIAVRKDVNGEFAPFRSMARWTMDMPIGRGTCSYIDECYSDEDIQQFLDEGTIDRKGRHRRIVSPKRAVRRVRWLACLLWNGE
jgi:hypothetical protein